MFEIGKKIKLSESSVRRLARRTLSFILKEVILNTLFAGAVTIAVGVILVVVLATLIRMVR